MLECEEIFGFQCSVLFLEHFELKILKFIFSIFRRFWKIADTEILELTLDTLQVPAGTCRLVIWSWISLMMNTWTIRYWFLIIKDQDFRFPAVLPPEEWSVVPCPGHCLEDGWTLNMECLEVWISMLVSKFTVNCYHHCIVMYSIVL